MTGRAAGSQRAPAARNANFLGVGFCLHPDVEYLKLARPILEEEADFFEVNPETMWRKRDGRLVRNDFHGLFQEIRERSGRPFVAHGLGFSLGTPMVGDTARTEAWLERLRDDQEAFRFEWMSEHLGWVTAGGLKAVLPLGLPFTEEAVDAVSARMGSLASVAPRVAFENNVNYFSLGPPGEEPDFWNAICAKAPCAMLLDLHNVFTQCRNNGLDARAFVDRIDLANVIEIHLSGGSDSEAEWLPSRRVMRLDSHDDAVPEEVWDLLDRVLPKCGNLRGIVVERLNGTFDADGLSLLRAEVRRAKEAAARC